MVLCPGLCEALQGLAVAALVLQDCLKGSTPFSCADHSGSDDLGLQLIKTQDTIPIHSAVMSQKIATNSLDYGQEYTVDKIDTLKPNREKLLDALSPLGTLGKGVWGGDAIYFFARLPKGACVVPVAASAKSAGYQMLALETVC